MPPDKFLFSTEINFEPLLFSWTFKRVLEQNRLSEFETETEGYFVNNLNVAYTIHSSTVMQKVIFQAENIFNQEDNIILIRSYINRSKRLIKLSDNYSKNRNLDQTISSYKPPIFWKEKDIVKKQLKIWDKDSLLNLIKELNKVELLIKKNVSSSKELLFDFLTNKCLD